MTAPYYQPELVQLAKTVDVLSGRSLSSPHEIKGVMLQVRERQMDELCLSMQISDVIADVQLKGKPNNIVSDDNVFQLTRPPFWALLKEFSST